MHHFKYQAGTLWAEDVPLLEIVSQVGSPCYIYSQQSLIDAWQDFSFAFQTHPHLICYAVKANSNLAVLNTLAKLGSGFDIVSQGELARVIAAGGSPSRVVFSGVGKTQDEMAFALKQGIFCFNVESEAELGLLNQVAQSLNLKAKIALRINPDVDSLSHPYISTGLKENKFGIDIQDALRLYTQASSCAHLEIKGIASHIGSQLTSLSPFVETVKRLSELTLMLKAKGFPLSHIDMGGGLGIRYQNETPPDIKDYANALLAHMPSGYQLLLEPGRRIAANAGILVTRVLFLKESKTKNFCIVDCAMNDLIRPALYNAWHEIIPVVQTLTPQSQVYDIVGPICETGDFLGKDRELSVKAGDYLAIRSVGAYGFATSSHYNSRPKACEVMVKKKAFKIIRPRESIEQLFAQEILW